MLCHQTAELQFLHSLAQAEALKQGAIAALAGPQHGIHLMRVQRGVDLGGVDLDAAIRGNDHFAF